jgi:hypothetical protein
VICLIVVKDEDRLQKRLEVRPISPAEFPGPWYVGEVDLENAGILKGLTSTADAARRKGVRLGRTRDLKTCGQGRSRLGRS